MTAVIYCRVSTKEQVQNLSLRTQLKACRDYCAREGFEVAKEYTDAGESAKTTDRPEFQKLLEFCRLHKRDVQFVVFYNVTRFSRSSLDFSIIKSLLLRLGISIRSANEPLSDDPVENLTGNIMAAIGQFDNDEKARRTKAGMKAALELGRWPFQAPLGYLNGGSNGKGHLVPDPVRAPLVRAAFEQYGTGRHTKADLLRRLTARGLTTPAGKCLTPQSLGALLRNPIYSGWLNVPSWRFSGPAEFEALVSPSLFRRVQDLLDGKGKPLKPHVRNHVDFPLRRFVACSLCVTPLTGSWSTGRAKKYAYYHCRKCGRVKTTKRELEQLFSDLLSRLQPEPAYMSLFKAIVLDVWKDREREAERLRADLGRVVRQKRERLDRVDDAFLHERSIDRTAQGRTPHRIVFEVTGADPQVWEAALNNIENVQEALGIDVTEIRVVAHGKGIGLVMQMNTALAGGIAALTPPRVKFVACENTMKRLKIQKEDCLAAAVDLVDERVSAIAQHLHRIVPSSRAGPNT
ncbi:MAG: recombinase family protein [Acidobacteriota bacterium]